MLSPSKGKLIFHRIVENQLSPRPLQHLATGIVDLGLSSGSSNSGKAPWPMALQLLEAMTDQAHRLRGRLRAAWDYPVDPPVFGARFLFFPFP